jgi:hypothetical protein
VFIHDLTASHDAWRIDEWPLPYDSVRILAYGYDTSQVEGLGDMFDEGYLKRCATKLLVEFPLSSYCRGEDIQRPVIFIAHGFGGLVYEQV